mmetsp:Transcript_56342/g.155956  ORF Transcript_56342/g.155956 Transcript_56342/m.155956 type:complete len:215 (+) Transcript_56342:1803-2447(+)
MPHLCSALFSVKPLTIASCCMPWVLAYSNSGLSGFSSGSMSRSAVRICSSVSPSMCTCCGIAASSSLCHLSPISRPRMKILQPVVSCSRLWFTPRGPMITPMKGAWGNFSIGMMIFFMSFAGFQSTGGKYPSTCLIMYRMRRLYSAVIAFLMRMSRVFRRLPALSYTGGGDGGRMSGSWSSSSCPWILRCKSSNRCSRRNWSISFCVSPIGRST